MRSFADYANVAPNPDVQLAFATNDVGGVGVDAGAGADAASTAVAPRLTAWEENTGHAWVARDTLILEDEGGRKASMC